MSTPLFDPTGHLLPHIIQQLGGGNLPAETRLAALEHLAGCPHCALALSQAIEAQPLVRTSPGFAQSTLEKLQQQPQRQQRQRPPAPRRNSLGFWAYTLRVTAAVCAALILTFSIDLSGQPGERTPLLPTLTFSEANGDSLKHLSERLFSTEVANHD